jgi:UDP:flavonoid glycosyltransferase YjiC (YdhE family)
VRAAVFAMSDGNHFRRTNTVVAALARAGVDVRVYSDRRFAAKVEACGATLADVFTPFPLERADAESHPMSVRNVTWAGRFGDAIVAEVRAFGPDLVLYDSFAVIGRVAGEALGVPYVAVVSGHNMDPARVVPEMQHDARVAISGECLEALGVLRGGGWADVSPFSYYDALSPHLNLYCEPPAFLTEAERPAFAPLAFWGSLPALDGRAPRPRGDRALPPRRIYASMGTISWRYFVPEAYGALRAVAAAVGRRSDLEAVISLGGASLDAAAVADLERPNVVVQPWVDQWEQLRAADAFVTHSGLNSTHEALFNRVPMISYPMFGDQPGLSVRSRDLGVAVALAGAPRAPVTDVDVDAALERLTLEAPAMDDALERAHAGELAVVAARPAVVERIKALAG